jgi:hypothetical protein
MPNTVMMNFSKKVKPYMAPNAGPAMNLNILSKNTERYLTKRPVIYEPTT